MYDLTDWDEIYDVDNCFNGGIYTVPSHGVYLINLHMTLFSLAAATYGGCKTNYLPPLFLYDRAEFYPGSGGKNVSHPKITTIRRLLLGDTVSFSTFALSVGKDVGISMNTVVSICKI